jgi:hypothetical protein
LKLLATLWDFTLNLLPFANVCIIFTDSMLLSTSQWPCSISAQPLFSFTWGSMILLSYFPMSVEIRAEDIDQITSFKMYSSLFILLLLYIKNSSYQCCHGGHSYKHKKLRWDMRQESMHHKQILNINEFCFMYLLL